MSAPGLSTSPSSVSNRRIALAIVCLLAALQFLIATAAAQGTARTAQRSLDQLVDEAATIVRGRVISAELQPHPQLTNLMTVVVSMSVQETYKGKPQSSLTFRQYVWDNSTHSLSDYRKGQQLVLLLRPVSEYGLTSPAGLEQGRFEVIPQKKHSAIALNGRDNIGLLDNLQEHARNQGLNFSPHINTILRRQRPQSIPVNDLAELIRTFARTR